MARTRTLVDLLAEQPEDQLLRMKQANLQETSRVQEELLRLTIEGRQIEEAIAKQARADAARDGRITAELVMDAARATEPPFSATEVQQFLATNGLPGSVNAVRNHLNRLVDRGDLVRNEDRTYSVPFVPKPAPVSADADFGGGSDDDIPF